MSYQRDVKQENTGWRDAALSARHRKWGWDLPTVDVDFLMIQYDKAEPIALVEYKLETAPEQHSKHPSYRAIIKLGTNAGILVFVVRYAKDLTWFKLTALNRKAREHIPKTITYTELEYVTFLYRLSNRAIPDDVKRALQ
jgi:hypothetical protein